MLLVFFADQELRVSSFYSHQHAETESALVLKNLNFLQQKEKL